jgi:serine/threonine protein kinase
LTGGYYFIYKSADKHEAAGAKLRNDQVETNLTSLNRVLKSIVVIQNLTKKLGELIPLSEKGEIEKKINQSDIKRIDVFKEITVSDMDGNIILQPVPAFTPTKKWKTIYAAKDFKIDAYSDQEIIIKISADVFYSDIFVGKAHVILSVPLPEQVSSRSETAYVIWLTVVILLFLLILFISAQFTLKAAPKDKGSEETSDTLPCWLKDEIITMFQYTVLELVLVKHRFLEGFKSFYSVTQEQCVNIERVGPYKIVGNKINSGRLADLYKARMERDNVDFAIRVLHPDVADNMAFIEQFRQEGRQAELLDHANIVQTVNFREKQNAIVTEYIEGANLAQMMAKKQILSIRRAVFIISEICKGLQYAHSYYKQSDDNKDVAQMSPIICHHNLKPGNIMLSCQGDVKISDFGISGLSATRKYVEYGVNRGVSYIISLKQELEDYYMNLTIADSSQKMIIYRQDVTSLGTIMFKMLSGKDKLDANNANEFEKFQNKTDIPDELKRIVSKCLVDDKQKYKSPLHLLDDLSQLNHSVTAIYDLSDLAYRSPEQIRGQHADHRSDIFSLGVIFYELLSGKPLWRNNSDAEAVKFANDTFNRYCFFRGDPKEKIKELNELNPDIPAELNSIVMRCLKDDVNVRYQNVQELYDRLTAFKELAGLNYDSLKLGALVKHWFGKNNKD